MKGKRGFTLVEAIIALTIFTIIVTSLSAVLNAALNAEKLSYQRQEDAGTVRAVFDSLTRDVQAAFASPNSPASVFIASSGGSSTSSASGLLTLSTLTQRIQADSLMSGQTSALQSGSSTGAVPQSDVALVRYSLDPQTGLLTRSVTPVPNTQLLSQTPDGPEKSLAEHVTAFSLQFYDPNQKTWRDNWDYEQPNQQQAQSASAANSATASGSAASPATTTGDSSLPTAVQVSMKIVQKSGIVTEFTTTIPIVAPLPQTDPNAMPTSTGTSSATPSTGG